MEIIIVWRYKRTICVPTKDRLILPTNRTSQALISTGSRHESTQSMRLILLIYPSRFPLSSL